MNDDSLNDGLRKNVFAISNILSKIWVVKGTNIMRILQLDGIAKKKKKEKKKTKKRKILNFETCKTGLKINDDGSNMYSEKL